MQRDGHELIVYSFAGELVSGIATSFDGLFTGEKIEYFDYVVLPDGGIAEPRKFLFHENWLDRAYAYNRGVTNLSMVYPDPFSHPPRPGITQPVDNLLAEFGTCIGESLVFEQVYTRGVLTPHRCLCCGASY